MGILQLLLYSGMAARGIDFEHNRVVHEPSTIMLVRPRNFGYNLQTAENNVFQEKPSDTLEDVRNRAQNEFDTMKRILEEEGVNVIVFNDTVAPAKPDAVFPNNWVSFHPDGRVILYPMFAPNRRFERRHDIIESLAKNFSVTEIIDLSHYEKENRFLEGTGSIVFDHKVHVAYACRSPRTDVGIFAKVCSMLDYEPVHFNSVDHGGQPVYHTNVMMCIGTGFAVICLDSITDAEEKGMVRKSLEAGGNEVVPISVSQLSHFAGNMLPVRGRTGDLLVLSQAAFNSLTPVQKNTLSRYCRLVPVPIGTIETVGGGSARCMMAEVFLPPR